jgi:hypothetical protein
MAADTAPLSESKTTENGLDLVFKYPPIFVSGKENIVELSVTNNSEVSIEYYALNDLKECRFVIKCDGRNISSTTLYELWQEDDSSFMRTKPVSLAKGEEIRASVNLTRLFDLSLPGEYEITPSWSGWTSASKRVSVTGSTVKVKVTDPPPSSPAKPETPQEKTPSDAK